MDGFRSSHYSFAVVLEYCALFGHQEIINQHVENSNMFFFLLDGLLEARLLQHLNQQQLQSTLQGFNKTFHSIFEPFSAVQDLQQIINTVPDRRLALLQTFEKDENLNIRSHLLKSVELDTKFQSFNLKHRADIQRCWNNPFRTGTSTPISFVVRGDFQHFSPPGEHYVPLWPSSLPM